MKVGVLTTSYPRFPGDYRGVFVKNLVDAVRGRGVEAEVIEPRGYDALKAGAGLIPNLRRSGVARVLFPFYCLHFLVIAIAKAGRCDLLHANWSLSGFFAVIAGRLRRKKVLLTERSSFLIETDNARVTAWMGWIMERCAAVVTISGGARDGLERKFPEIDVGVIPNGVDDALFSPTHREAARKRLELDDSVVHIVTVGRLTDGKRLDVLLAACSMLVTDGREFHAWIVGSGELHDPLRRQVAASKELSQRITLVGQQTQDQVASWLAAADAFVLTSAAESGGNVVLEAMATGTALVSTPVGWAADFISSGENGIITPVGDVAALADALGNLIADQALRRALGSAARATIEAHGLNWDGCAGRYIERYREIA